MEQLDTLLCQVNALPRLSPPVLCAFRPSRRISLPTETFFTMASSFIGQEEQHAARTDSLQKSVGNVAARLGTALYQGYLSKALRELSELVKTAGMYARQMGDTAFPTVACPRNYTEGCDAFREEDS